MRHLILAAAVLLVTACGADAPTVEPPTAAPSSAHPTTSEPALITAEALAGREFLSTSLTGRDLVPGTRVSLHFEVGGWLHGGGCNGMDGSWALEGTTLDAQYGPVTEVGCPPGRHEQDVWFGEFISSDPTASIDGDELVLRGGGLTMTFLDRQVEEPDRPLAGTQWTLTTLAPEDAPAGMRMGVPDGAHASFLVQGDRPMIRIDTGCNTGQASVTVDGMTMSIGPLALTRGGCVGDATWIERQMTTVLQGEVSFEIDHRVLHLSSPGGFLFFEAE